MPTIAQLKPEELRSPDIFEKIKEVANPLVIHIDSREALDLVNQLNRLLKASNLESQNPELYKKYQDLIVRLRWAALPFLPDEEATDLLRENLLKTFSDEYIDTETRLEAKMLLVPFLVRDNLRQKLNRAIKENDERLGARTIGEWITDYIKTYDIRDRTAVSHLEYISRSPEAQTLSSENKDILRRVLHLFDYYLVITPLVDYFLAQEVYKELLKEEQKGKPVPIRPMAAPTFVAPSVAIKPKEIREEEKAPGEISIYEGKVSPYEREREIIPPAKPFEEEIPKRPPRVVPKEVKKEPKKPSPETSYQIRTMKQDIEKAKKQPMPTGRQAIPPKPKPKIKDNIVDLSGK